MATRCVFLYRLILGTDDLEHAGTFRVGYPPRACIPSFSAFLAFLACLAVRKMSKLSTIVGRGATPPASTILSETALISVSIAPDLFRFRYV